MPQSTHHDLHQALVALQRGAGHLLDEFYEKIGRHHASISGHVAEVGQPPADISDGELGFEVSIELPGIEEKDLDVTVVGDRLIVKGEKRQESEKKTKTYYSRERVYGAVERTFWLPPGVDGDKARAVYSNGVLHITMPRKKGSKAVGRKVQIGGSR